MSYNEKFHPRIRDWPHLTRAGKFDLLFQLGKAVLVFGFVATGMLLIPERWVITVFRIMIAAFFVWGVLIRPRGSII